MNKKYDTAVVIGRFQPLHHGHLDLIDKAAGIARNVVIVVGSAHQPRTFKNPWTSLEREKFILKSVDYYKAQYRVEHNIDTIHDDFAWRDRVLDLVGESGKTILVGHHKDSSSFYLDMFPQWDFMEVDSCSNINATDIRKAYFWDSNRKFLCGTVPKVTYDLLDEMLGTEEYYDIVEEYKFLENNKEVYASLPYSPIFVTADAMVVHKGYVLLVKRKNTPGKGLWALPGGYVNANTDKSVQDAAIRELKEETGISTSRYFLNAQITKQRTFDTIGRSARGRIITTCFLIDLVGDEVPTVTASDDAAEAKWVYIHELDISQMFEDHYEIIQDMIKDT